MFTETTSGPYLLVAHTTHGTGPDDYCSKTADSGQVHSYGLAARLHKPHRRQHLRLRLTTNGCLANMKATVRRRLNPATNKMETSYLRKDQTPVFIQRACMKCEKKGYERWHFDFDCRQDPALKVYVVDYVNTIHGSDIYGCGWPRTDAATSCIPRYHQFSVL